MLLWNGLVSKQNGKIFISNQIKVQNKIKIIDQSVYFLMGIKNDYFKKKPEERRIEVINNLQSKGSGQVKLFVEDVNGLSTFLGKLEFELIDILADGSKKEKKYKKNENQELVYKTLVYKGKGRFESGFDLLDLGLEYESWIYPGGFFKDIDVTRIDARAKEVEDEVSLQAEKLLEENKQTLQTKVGRTERYADRFFQIGDIEDLCYMKDQMGKKHLLCEFISKLTIQKLSPHEKLLSTNVLEIMKEFPFNLVETLLRR